MDLNNNNRRTKKYIGQKGKSLSLEQTKDGLEIETERGLRFTKLF